MVFKYKLGKEISLSFMEKNLCKTLISLKLYHLNIIIKDIDMKVKLVDTLHWELKLMT